MTEKTPENKEISQKFLELSQVMRSETLTLMASILGYSKLLLDEHIGPLNDQQKYFAAIIYKNVEQTGVMLEDYVVLIQILVGEVPTKIEVVDIKMLVEEAVSHLTTEIERKNQSLTIQLPDLPSVHSSKWQLTEILTRILQNANRYTPDNGKITLTAEQQDRYAKITVEDTGIGISAEYKDEIFKEFFRVPSTEVYTNKGLGLGLFFSKYYVENLGGKIGFESQPGKGSRFWFAIPTSHKENDY